MKKVLSIALLFAAANLSLNAGPRDWNYKRILLGSAGATGTYFSVKAALNPQASTSEKVACGAAALASTYCMFKSVQGAFPGYGMGDLESPVIIEQKPSNNKSGEPTLYQGSKRF